MTHARTRVQGGSGLLARSQTRLLFVPQPSEGVDELIDAMRAADAAAALGDVLVRREFDAPGFVYLDWDTDVALMVFGPVEVSTDQPSLPMLSGAGSQTWVEHRLRNIDGAVAIAVDAPVGDETDLREGVVPAGGFALELIDHHAEGSTVASPPPPADEVPAASADMAADAEGPVDQLDEPPHPIDPPNEVTDLGALPPPTIADAAPPAPTDDLDLGALPPPPSDDLDLSALPPPPSDDLDLSALPPPMGDAPPMDPPPPEAADVVDLPPPSAADVVDLPPPEADGVTIVVGDASDSPALVEAKTCPNGHHSSRLALVCRVCGASLADAPVTNIPRPSLGSLTFDDGSRVTLDRSCEIGRQPEPAAEDIRPIVVDGPKVSRRHVLVTVRDWDVLVEDLGSRNGTLLIADGSDDSDPHPLTKGMPVSIEPGAIVHLGTTYFTYSPEA